MRTSRPGHHRILRGLPVVAVAMAVLAGCGSGGGAATTITQTVTASPTTIAVGTAPAGAGGSGAPTSGGAITVVGPSGAAQTTEPASGDAGATTPTATTATTTSAPPTTLSPEAAAASALLGTSCGAVLFTSDLAAALGKAPAAKLGSAQLRVVDVANPANHMTGRTKCYYGTEDLATARPVVVAIAAYSDAESAAGQLSVTVASEREAGAAASTTDGAAAGQKIQVLVRDGGFAITQVGAATVSIAIARGVIGESAMKSALTLAMRSALGHLAAVK